MKMRALLLSLVIASGSFMSLDAKLAKAKTKPPKMNAAAARARKARPAKVKPGKAKSRYKAARPASKSRMRKTKKFRTV